MEPKHADPARPLSGEVIGPDNPEMRTSDEIQAALWETIQRLEAGELTPAQANAITRKAGAKIAAAQAALRVAKLAGRLDALDAPTSRRLGPGDDGPR